MDQAPIRRREGTDRVIVFSPAGPAAVNSEEATDQSSPLQADYSVRNLPKGRRGECRAGFACRFSCTALTSGVRTSICEEIGMMGRLTHRIQSA